MHYIDKPYNKRVVLINWMDNHTSFQALEYYYGVNPKT
jgi:hypothetical protein